MGAENAAAFIHKIREFSRAEVIKVNPDAPQSHVRRIVLEQGKRLIMPTPRISSGFLLLEPKQIPRQLVRRAVSIAGAFKLARSIPLSELPPVDFIVAGSVAVSKEGARIGKGEGYSELEYGVLREIGLVNEGTKIATTVHDCQILQPFQTEEHDLPVDYVLTPTRMIETRTPLPRPRGIYWEKVTADMLRKIPILQELHAMAHSK